MNDEDKLKAYRAFSKEIQHELFDRINTTAINNTTEANAVDFTLHSFAYSLGCACAGVIHRQITDPGTAPDVKKEEMALSLLLTHLVQGWTEQTQVLVGTSTKEKIMAEPANKPFH